MTHAEIHPGPWHTNFLQGFKGRGRLTKNLCTDAIRSCCTELLAVAFLVKLYTQTKVFSVFELGFKSSHEFSSPNWEGTNWTNNSMTYYDITLQTQRSWPSAFQNQPLHLQKPNAGPSHAQWPKPRPAQLPKRGPSDEERCPKGVSKGHRPTAHQPTSPPTHPPTHPPKARGVCCFQEWHSAFEWVFVISVQLRAVLMHRRFHGHLVSAKFLAGLPSHFLLNCLFTHLNCLLMHTCNTATISWRSLSFEYQEKSGIISLVYIKVGRIQARLQMSNKLTIYNSPVFSIPWTSQASDRKNLTAQTLPPEQKGMLVNYWTSCLLKGPATKKQGKARDRPSRGSWDLQESCVETWCV